MLSILGRCPRLRVNAAPLARQTCTGLLMSLTARKPSFLGRVQIIALDFENSVPSCAIILERDLRAQLHQLFFGKLIGLGIGSHSADA